MSDMRTRAKSEAYLVFGFFMGASAMALMFYFFHRA